MKYKHYIVLMIYMSLVFQTYAQFPKTWDIDIIDNHDNTLSKMLGFPQKITNDSIWKTEQRNLLENLGKWGYLSPDIHTETVNDSVIISKIIAGIHTQYISFSTENNEELTPIWSKFLLDKKNVILFEKNEHFLQETVQYFQNSGHPFVKVQWTNIELVKDTMKAVLKIEKGNIKTINKIIIEPYTQFPTKFLKNYFEIQNGDLFNEQIIRNMAEKSAHLSLINSIKPPEVTFTQDTTYLFLFWEKAKKNSIDGLMGVSNTEQKFKLNGHLNLRLLNAFNKGEHISLEWLSDGNRSQVLNSKVILPYFVKTPFDVELGFEMYRKDTTFMTTKTQTGILYHWNRYNALGIKWLHHSSTVVQETILSDFENYTGNFYGINYSLNLAYIGNKMLTHKLHFENDFYRGKRNQENQYLLQSDLSYMVDINDFHYITFRNQAGYLQSNHLFENELFRIGGIQNSRGFKEKSIPCSLFNTIWIDYHYFDTKVTELSLLTDVSFLRPSNLQNVTLYSLGVGFKNLTPQGLFDISYCIGNQVGNDFGFKNGMLHIKYSQTF